MPVPRTDLAEVLDRVADDLRSLDGARLLVTGGTGFFGRWLLSSYAAACDTLRLRGRAVVLTRDPAAFGRTSPELAGHRAIDVVSGDVLRPPSDLGQFDGAILAATSASQALTDAEPRRMFDTIVTGTANVLDLLAGSGQCRCLFTSSGAVYGRQPEALTHVPETFLGAVDALDVRSVYAEAKRAAEMLCATSVGTGPLPVIARCFAFVGPCLPIDTHFAIGNFVRDALAGGPILVQGDGSSIRTYMYPTDLVVWLWSLLLRGAPGRAYNVGSEVPVDIATTAAVVADSAGGIEVVVRGVRDPAQPVHRYVPDTSRARNELGLSQQVDLADAVSRTLAWHRSRETGSQPRRYPA